MKNFVMGTAGHIDHGKTTLVKRLTGVDTDRLEEEKRRGMTIELGFAPFLLPSGNTLSIIDVPGHEKFVRTMVAGATGIDFVMLVIAADEGIMPQTKEHIEILSLLNVNSGVVALTKSDLVDDEWIKVVKNDIEKALSGTALEGISIIEVSAVTGNGIDTLVEYLEKLVEQAATKNSQEVFRLPIDRVFTVSGHGTIITGTVGGGKILKGDTIEILPSGLRARIRNIQVHNQTVENAEAGDRCALNLGGVEKTDILRGNVAVNIDTIHPVKIVDAVLHTIKGSTGIKHNQHVHVHLGTQEVMARARIIGAEEIPEGEKGYVQLRFEEPVTALRGDRFIIRANSPITTVGGGWILFHSVPNRQRFDKETLELLEMGESGRQLEIINLVLKASGTMLNLDQLWKETLISRDTIRKSLEDEIENGEVVYLKEIEKYLSNETYIIYSEMINGEFEKLYKKYPYRFEIDKEEIKSKIFSKLDVKSFTALINSFIENKLFILENNSLVQTKNNQAEKIYAMRETKAVEKIMIEDGMNLRNTQQISGDINIEPDKIEEIQKFLINTGRLTDIGQGILIHKSVLKSLVEVIRKILGDKGYAAIGEIRDTLKVGRKSAVALMEYLDSLGVTRRTENVREPGIHFMDYFI